MRWLQRREGIRLSIARCLALAFLLSSPAALAVGDAGPHEAFSVDVQPLAAFGVAGGFPAFQSATALASVQYKWAGLAVRGGYGTAGVQASLDLRGYPPIAAPVPVYAAFGVNLYGSRVAYHAALGAHVPVSLRWRIDVEAGTAWVPLGFDRTLAPHVVVGVSYAIPFDPNIGFGARDDTAEEPLARDASTRCPDPTDVSTAGVDDAVADVARRFLQDAQSVYGSVYADLRYDWDVEETEFSGTRAVVEVDYSGSVREIATGERVSAQGTATVDLRWTGCGWTGTGLSY